MIAFKSVLKVDDVQRVCKQIEEPRSNILEAIYCFEEELNLIIKNFKIS